MLLWGFSAYVGLTEGARMCFLLQLLSDTNTSVSVVSMCASVHVFILVTTPAHDINSKASPVFKLQPDVTKNYCISKGSLGCWDKEANYTYPACPWIYGIIKCTSKASPGVLCLVLNFQYRMDFNKLGREKPSTAETIGGLQHMAKKGQLREPGLFNLIKRRLRDD